MEGGRVITFQGHVLGATEARERLSRIASQLDNPRAFTAEAGKHLEVTTRRHFRDRDAEGNRNNWPSRHFFLRQGRDVTSLTEVTSKSATVTIASREMAHKLRGGTVRPKRGRWLTIPFTAEAYRVWPRNWTGSRLFRPRGAQYLATSNGAGGLTPQYWLAESVTHKPDPDVLPDMERETQDILHIAERHIARMLDRR